MGQKAKLKKARRAVRALIDVSPAKERLPIAQSAWEHGLFSKRLARRALEKAKAPPAPGEAEPEHAPVGVEAPVK